MHKSDELDKNTATVMFQQTQILEGSRPIAAGLRFGKKTVKEMVSLGVPDLTGTITHPSKLDIAGVPGYARQLWVWEKKREAFIVKDWRRKRCKSISDICELTHIMDEAFEKIIS